MLARGDVGVGRLFQVRFEQVGYAYPGADRRSLSDIELIIEPGEMVGIVGATGAGKSTLCLTLNGIVPQFFGGDFYGAVTIGGADTTEDPTSSLAARVGMVFEDPETQITATTVESEVAFALENLNVPSAIMRARVDDALRAVGLEGLEHKHPANLSGGQKQRLAIASALALEPALIVLDEPTSQLDPVGNREIFALLARLNRERGLTVVIASHASEELAATASRIILLSEGRIVRDGTPGEVLGDVALMRAHNVRPPDVAQAYAAVTDKQTPNSHRLAPVTLEAGRALLVPLLPDRVEPCAEAAPIPTAAAPVLEARGVTHTYPDGTVALQGIDLSIGRGEFVAIGGRNGCGKSTLIRHFLNLLQATSGEVRVAGENVASLTVAQLAGRIGYVSQNAHQQLFCDSVEKEVSFALRLTRRSPDEIAQSVAAALRAMKLEGLAARHPMSLSRGDRLRVAIAATLALEPEILIFDEPTTGQDWRGAVAILDICRALNQAGKTIVLVTHHLYLLPGYVGRLVVMNGGRVLADGPLSDVFYNGEMLAAASLAPPQTVALVAELPAFARAGVRPLSPADLGRMVIGTGARVPEDVAVHPVEGLI